MASTAAATESCTTPTDEELRKLLIPDPTAEQVVEAIRQSFFPAAASNDGTTTAAVAAVDIQIVKELDSYDDKNVWLSINGKDFLAKVHNGVESKDLIDRLDGGSGAFDSSSASSYKNSAIHLQNAMMMHLNQHGIVTNDPQMAVPKGDNNNNKSSDVLPTPGAIHSLPVVSKAHSPCPLVVRLLGWVPGRPMSSIPMIPIEALANAGIFLGKLSTCLSKLSSNELAAAKRYHQWDGKNTLDVRDFLQYIADDRKRGMVASVLDAFQTELIDSKVAETSFAKGLIHADFNDANFLLDGNFCVSGVIDFGDSVESWRILDLSVAMAYSLLTVYGKQNRSLSAAAALLRGYNSVCPPTEVERKHLLLLMACRLSCSVTLGAYSYQQNPGNEYLLLHAAPAWNALELIWGTDPDRRAAIRIVIDGLFDRACSKSTPANSTTPIDCSDLAFPDPALEDPLAGVRCRH